MKYKKEVLSRKRSYSLILVSVYCYLCKWDSIQKKKLRFSFSSLLKSEDHLVRIRQWLPALLIQEIHLGKKIIIIIKMSISVELWFNTRCWKCNHDKSCELIYMKFGIELYYTQIIMPKLAPSVWNGNWMHYWAIRKQRCGLHWSCSTYTPHLRHYSGIDHSIIIPLLWISERWQTEDSLPAVRVSSLQSPQKPHSAGATAKLWTPETQWHLYRSTIAKAMFSSLVPSLLS